MCDDEALLLVLVPENYSFKFQAYLPKGALLFGYHSIYSSPWAPSAEIERNHWQMTQVLKQL
jgi:hypothetical protein